MNEKYTFRKEKSLYILTYYAKVGTVKIKRARCFVVAGKGVGDAGFPKDCGHGRGHFSPLARSIAKFRDYAL